MEKEPHQRNDKRLKLVLEHSPHSGCGKKFGYAGKHLGRLKAFGGEGMQEPHERVRNLAGCSSFLDSRGPQSCHSDNRTESFIFSLGCQSLPVLCQWHPPLPKTGHAPPP